MLIMLKQRRRQTATERTPFAPFAGMLVDGLAAQDQRVGGGLAALMLSQRRLSAPRLRHSEPRSRWRFLSRSRALRPGPHRSAMAAALIHN